MKTERNLLLAAAVAAVLLPGAHAYAQGALEEIIVTAERRATTETTTAISMNVLSGEDLANTQTKNIADLQTSTPNVTINNPGGFNSINIRGIGNSAIQPSISVGVAVFQDGMLNAETITLSNQFLDLGTVEVLRGPQGTFVGGSSTGGAIRLNSVKPEIAGGVKGFIEAQTGTKSQVKITGAVNLPISDTFAARIAFNQEKRDSYFYSRGTLVGRDPANPFQMPGSVNDQGGRVSLLWAPNDKWEFVWRSEFNRSDIQGSPAQPNPRTFRNALGVQTNSRYWDYDGPTIAAIGDVNTTLAGVQLAANAGSVDPNHDPDVLSINLLDAQFESIVDRHSLEWTYEFDGGMTFRSLTGFVHNDVKYIEDGDGSFANAVVNRNDVGPDNNYYSQEINLISAEGPLNWILGSNWFYRSTIPNNVSETYTCGISPVNGSFTPCPLTFNRNNELPSTTFAGSYAVARAGAVFGQVNWTFVDDLEVTLGGRYNVDKNYSQGRDLPGGVVAVIPNGGPSPGNCPADVAASSRYTQYNWAATSCVFPGAPSSYDDENITYKVGLNWTPGDNLFYAFYARGYKAGGAQAAGQFEPEQVDDYELGYKGTILDGNATFSVGAFFMDYQKIQQQAFNATPTSAGNAVVNVGEATIQGLEAEFNAKFGGLGISVNAGYVDSELGSVRIIDRTLVPDASVRAPGTTTDLPQCRPGVAVNLVGQNLGGCADYTPYYLTASGERNIYSPELQWGITLDYDIAGANGTWTPRVSFSHTDEQDINLIRREDFWVIPERDLLNVSLTYTADKWLTQAFVNNAADETYIAAIGTGGGLTNDSVVYGNPLVWGLRFRYNFE
jgi:iron complex outermembrane receptor protein